MTKTKPQQTKHLDRNFCWNAGLWRRHDHDRSAWAISAWVIPAYFVGQRRFPLLFLYHHHLEIINQSIKPTVERVSYILHDSSISRDPHLLTISAPPWSTPQLACLYALVRSSPSAFHWLAPACAPRLGLHPIVLGRRLKLGTPTFCSWRLKNPSTTSNHAFNSPSSWNIHGG